MGAAMWRTSFKVWYLDEVSDEWRMRSAAERMMR